MSVLTRVERDASVKELLTQYRSYKRAWFSWQRRRIGDAMVFLDPIVWIRYKQAAYQGTSDALSTWGDLVTHSQSHAGICGKRLNWLAQEFNRRGIDMFDESVLSSTLPLLAVSEWEPLVTLAHDEELMAIWQQFELYREQGRRCKWAQYQQ